MTDVQHVTTVITKAAEQAWQVEVAVRAHLQYCSLVCLLAVAGIDQ
jgi:hypothetical protein